MRDRTNMADLREAVLDLRDVMGRTDVDDCWRRQTFRILTLTYLRLDGDAIEEGAPVFEAATTEYVRRMGLIGAEL